MDVVLTVLLVTFLVFFFLGFVPTFLVAIIVFRMHLIKTKPNKWSRDVSSLEDERQIKMYNEGLGYVEPYKDKLIDVSIQNDSLTLRGQYLNLGFDKTVIIIPGRTEGCIYSYYFSKPYIESNFNILFIDNRAHGLSEGKYNTVGLKEYKDILKWAEMIHNTYNIDTIIIHGICIGSATGIYSLTLEQRPYYLKGIVTEGMYINFYEVYKNHIIYLDKPVFPFMEFTMLLFKLWFKIDPLHNGPIDHINKLNVPILMLQSKTDIFSLPENAEKLYQICGSKDKELVYFEKADHSMIRNEYQEKYDSSIKLFLDKYF